MVTHESWIRAVCASVTDWVWHHRILLYIALVVTITLVVQVLHIDFVGE